MASARSKSRVLATAHAKAARYPTDDLISDMVAAWRAEATATREELRKLLVTLVFGAHDNRP
jgi:cytochrome P450